ncbi:MAG: transcription-repair coupling factor, partial [Pseudomonadota bacterium]
KERLLAHTDFVEAGSETDRDGLAQKLADAGYEREQLVEEPGQFAVRGGVVDFFPPHLPLPVRLELSGDEVESIRSFDPVTQRSLENLREASWIPCREILLESGARAVLKTRLKELADARDLPRIRRAALEEALEDLRYAPAMESLLPVFYDTAVSLFDYVREGALWVGADPFDIARERDQLASEFRRLRGDFEQRQLLAAFPEESSIPVDSAWRRLEPLLHVELSDVALDEMHAPAARKSSVESLEDLRRAMLEKIRAEHPLAALVTNVRNWRSSGLGVLFVAQNGIGAARISDLLKASILDLTVEADPSPGLMARAAGHPVVTSGPLSSGFRWDERRVVFLTEHELFRDRKHSVTPQVAREDLFASISELMPGDPVVHIDFGVGIYRGLERITAGGIPNDFLHLEYAGGDKLYLPVYRLNRIQKYVGADGTHARVDRLGNHAAWEKSKAKARKAVEQMAQELIELYAKRQIGQGYAFGKPDTAYFEFEADFPFDETRDQIRTLDEVSADLETERPMDRLVCGDVGFGKTEVALRAAYRATMEGKQTAVLVPTTILAQQHFETFQTRLKEYPVRVEFLSRFKTAAQQKKTVKDVKEGKIDILIGTHRILSKDVGFKDLGLLVIDEEHRFGVKHKERIQQFRNNVHVMTLTATPIPRTLQMSIAGIRDLSVINTPPLDRKAIQTYLCRFDESVIQGAIRKELARHGEVFFVHNKVETIANMGRYLKKLVPEARIEIAHGQMAESQLEKTMHRFLKKEFDVLLCTTIIESGLDIPSANTILVNRADQFGLAQLYQLRGRVGRSDREAFAYLMIPGEELIARDALRRLKVLKRFTELGSGLKVALHDLEIRGAGNLLGPTQSGHIAAVGLELYTQLLDREVRKLKGEVVQDEVDPEIQCHVPAFLPEDYVASTGERLLLYKRLSAARSDQELENLRLELKDRFGPPPPPVENLLEVIELKILARHLGVQSLKLSEKPSIEFADRAPVNVDRVLKLVRKDRRLSLRPDNRLILDLGTDTDAFGEVKKILQNLV